MAYTEFLRTRTGKLYRDDVELDKFSLDVSLGRLHYSSIYGAETFENDLDFDAERITAGGYDGWRVTAAPFVYYLGQYPDNPGDGWVGFGGRRGARNLFFRLLRVGYMRWSDRDFWDIGGAPDYDRANLSQETLTTTLPTIGDSINTGTRATWADLWTTPGGGSLSVEWLANGDRIKELVSINQAGRDWIQANRNPLDHWVGESLDNIFFGFVFQLDVSDIPRWVIDGIDQDIDGDFNDAGIDTIEMRDALDNLIGLLPISDALVIDDDLEVARLRLQKRIYQTGGEYYLLIGARVDQLLTLPSGTLMFDPTIDPTTAASADDGRQRLSDSSVSYTVTTARLGGSTDSHVYFRFQLTGPGQSDTVDVAYLSLYATQSNRDDIDAEVVDAVATDSASQLSGTTSEISNMTLTGNAVTWNNTGTGVGYYNSPSLVTPTQAIIDRVGWASGQYIGWVVNDSDDDGDYQHAHYDYGSNEPIFHLEYTAAGAAAVSNLMLLGVG